MKEYIYMLIQWYCFILIMYYLSTHGFDNKLMIIGLWVIPVLIGIRAFYKIMMEEET